MTDQIEAILLDMGGALRDAVKEVVPALFRRGYRMGLIAGAAGSENILAALSELNIVGCVEAIVFSSQAGESQPDPAVLLEAANRMGVAPEQCAYVGNRIDATEVLQSFPERSAPQPAVVYDASLSTMWAIQNFPTLPDFFEAARRLGFARIELNHKVTSAMLAGIDLARYEFSSVHEPCPADIGEVELKKRDWLISSTDEVCRQEGVRAVMRSIDLAKRVGAGLVVIHAGHASPDPDGLEKKLRAMIDRGEQDSDAYRAIQEQMIRLRRQNAPASFASVQKSIRELLAYAAPSGICLGIEDRYHYLEHPSPDELSVLLDLAGAGQIGFLYDMGHAHTLERLGFIPHLEWLERFSSRVVGIHLHDAVGVIDHRMPGKGEVDFNRISAYLPATAVHTLELNNGLRYGEVKDALSYLAQRSCILILQDARSRNGE